VSISVRKTSLGLLCRKKEDQNGDLFQIAEVNATIRGNSINIKQFIWINGGKVSAIFAMDKLATTQNASNGYLEEKEVCFHSDDEEAVSVNVFHDKPHFIIIDNVSAVDYVYHVDNLGNVFAGSNTYAEGHLCLGEAPNPFDFSAVDMFVNSESNSDLYWKGQALRFSKEEDNQFIISSWPTTEIQTAFPKQLENLFKR